MPDNVNHPEHYTRFKGIEVIDITEQLNFNRGNVVKYVARAGAKAGSDEKEDLRKAEWYLQRELARLGATPGSNHTTEFRHSDNKKELFGVSKDIEKAILASELPTHLKMAMSDVLHGLNYALGERKGQKVPQHMGLFKAGTDGRYQGVVDLMVEAAAKPTDRKEIPLKEAEKYIKQLQREIYLERDSRDNGKYPDLLLTIQLAMMARQSGERVKCAEYLKEAKQLLHIVTEEANQEQEEHIYKKGEIDE